MNCKKEQVFGFNWVFFPHLINLSVGMAVTRIHFLMQAEKSCFLTLPCNSQLISNKESWKMHLETSSMWRSEFRHLFPFHQQQQDWDNPRNATITKRLNILLLVALRWRVLNNSHSVASDFKIRKCGLDNMENFMFMLPKADLFFSLLYHLIPLNLAKLSLPLTAVTSLLPVFCLGGCWLRTRLCETNQ